MPALDVADRFGHPAQRVRAVDDRPDLPCLAYHALDSHILGFTLWQLGHSARAKAIAGERGVEDVVAAFVPQLRAQGYPHLAEHAEQHLAAPDDGGASDFEFGLDLILDGLERARANRE